MTMTIGLAGRKQSGKTSVALRMVESGFVRVSFADAMRSMIKQLLVSCGYSPGHAELLLLSEKEKRIDELGKSPRQLMQLLGTDWGRHLIHEDMWVMAAKKRLDALEDFNVVFDDVRFENEAKMIRINGGLIVHIDRGLDSFDPHCSEAGIMRRNADAVVENDGSLEDLYFKVFQAISDNTECLK